MAEDCIYLNREMLDYWCFDLESDFSSAMFLLNIFLLADPRDNICRININAYMEHHDITSVKLDRLLRKFSDSGFIEVYREQISKNRGYKNICIALRHNELIDFEGEETYPDLPLYSFNSGRTTLAYKQWRIKCLERDNYTCQKCGCTENLHVHHIKPYANNPKLATKVSNGITLCKDCHKLEHRR